MSDLHFYRIKQEYLDYLRQFENKVPNFSKNNRIKPFCGVVLNVNNNKYYAPISSYSKSEYTNFPIKNIDKDSKKIKIISTIRFCFMIPVPDDVLYHVDFDKEDYKYRNLLKKEYLYCLDNKDIIINKANKIFNLKPTHHWFSQCCDFNLLEQKCAEYEILQEVALTSLADNE